MNVKKLSGIFSYLLVIHGPWAGQYCLRRTRGWIIAGGSTEILKNRIAEEIFGEKFSQRPPRPAPSDARP